MASVDEKRAPAAAAPTAKVEAAPPSPPAGVKPEPAAVPVIASFEGADFEDAEVEQVCEVAGFESGARVGAAAARRADTPQRTSTGEVHKQ